MNHTLRITSERGFTLIEILIAIVILGTAFMGLANMQLSCINGNSNSNQLTKAIILAQDKMEELKSLNPDHPDLADTNPSNNSNLRQSFDSRNCDHGENHLLTKRESTQSVTDLSSGTYTRIWNVADNTPFPGKKTVVVVVTWGTSRKSVAVPSVI